MLKGEIQVSVSDDYLELDEAAFDKIKCDLRHGKRVWWYTQEEMDFWRDEGETEFECEFSGIVLAASGCELPSPDADGDMDDRVICYDQHPTDKCYPEVSYVEIASVLGGGTVAIVDDPVVQVIPAER